MGFQEAIQSGLQNYANFSGRSSRSAYWYWYLFTVILAIVLAVVEAIIGTYPLISLLVFLGLILPGFAVGTRRFHDTGKSAWNWLWSFVPFGSLYILYLFVKASDEGSNDYGDGPMAPPA